MIIGGRAINGINCTMRQTAYNTLTVEIEGIGAQEFIGRCDNSHISEVWTIIGEALS
jgi:hypothetical protein